MAQRRRVEMLDPELGTEGGEEAPDNIFAGPAPSPPPPAPLDRTDPEPADGPLQRFPVERGTDRPSVRAEAPRTSLSPERQLGAPATPSQSMTPTPAADGAPSAFTPLPSPSPQSLVGAAGGGPTAATPADGAPSPFSARGPRTFGTLPGSPVLGTGGGLVGGGLTTPGGIAPGNGEAEVDDLLAAILAMVGGDAI